MDLRTGLLWGGISMALFFTVRGVREWEQKKPVQDATTAPNASSNHPKTPEVPSDYRYTVAEDAWQAPSIDESQFTGESFVIELHDQGFHEVVIMPTGPAWSNSNFQIVNPATGSWYAFWPQGRTQGTLPIFCNVPGAGYHFDSAPTFRLQGTEGLKIRFYNSHWHS